MVRDDLGRGAVSSLEMRRTIALVAVIAALAGVAAAGAAVPGPRACGSMSIGPGALKRGSTKAAECLLRRYEQQCRPAVYELSMFGVDTVETERFQVGHVNGRCEIAVTRAFSVVPQKPRVTAHGHCRTLRQSAANVVAGGCSGSGLEATVSLTSAGR